MTARAAAVLVALAAATHAHAAENEFPLEQVRKGAAMYEQNCSPCHGNQMKDPDAAFDLRKFPPDQKPRFVNSVTKGKNAMPPWGDLLKPDDIDALWAYVRTGER
jgi:mono/diheme cytochrome c family protein